MLVAVYLVTHNWFGPLANLVVGLVVATGTFAADKRNVLTGSAGVSLEMGPDTELTLEGLIGNGTAGGRVGVYGDSLDGFLSANLIYHQPLLTTAEAILNKGRTARRRQPPGLGACGAASRAAT